MYPISWVLHIQFHISPTCIVFILHLGFMYPSTVAPWVLCFHPKNVSPWVLWFLVCLHPTINPAVGNYALNLDDMIQEGEAQQGILVGQCLYIEPKEKLI